MKKPAGIAAFWSITRESLPVDRMRARVLQVLAGGQPRTPRDIAWPNGLLPTSVQAALLDLVRAGRVIRTGEIGRYRYTLAAPIAGPTTIAPEAAENSVEEPA